MNKTSKPAATKSPKPAKKAPPSPPAAKPNGLKARVMGSSEKGPNDPNDP